MEKSLHIDGAEKNLTIEKKGDAYIMSIDGREYEATGATINDGVLTFFIGTRVFRALVSKNVLGTQISMHGRDYFSHTREEEEATAAGAHHHGSGTIEAPMPGNVVAVHVAKGDTVSAGDAVVVIESMKMQNQITAPIAGEVRVVNCKAGDQIAFGDLLVEIVS